MKIVDIHTHGISGYDTRTANYEDILKIAEIHGSSGVTDIVPTVYSAPLHVMRTNMLAVKKAMEAQGARVGNEELRMKNNESQIKGQGLDNSKLNIQNSKLPSCILGVHLEGPFLNPAKCGALDPSSFIKPAVNKFLKLIEGFEDMVKIITIAPELDGSLNIIKRASDTDIIVSMGHSDATFAEAEAGYNAGAKGITHIFNAMRSMHHREPGIAGFGLINKDIYVEVIADPFHLHPDMLKFIFRAKNPDRIIIISDSIRETPGLTHSTDNLFGVQGSKITGTLCGGSATITESAHRLIEIDYDRKIILKCVSENPASIIFHLN